jgi:hypothetical protein
MEMLDIVLAVVWAGVVLGFLYAKREKYFPSDAPLPERQAKNPVPNLFWSAFILGMVARFLVRQQEPAVLILAGASLSLAAETLFIVAGCRMAYKRGRPWPLGALGFVGPIGLLVIYLIGKKKDAETAV